MVPLLLVPEAADVMRVKPEDVDTLITEGKLPAVVLDSGEIRVNVNDLRRFLRARTVPFMRGSRARLAEISTLKRMWRGDDRERPR